MNIITRFCAVSMLFLTTMYAVPASAAADIFLVYIGVDKKIQKTVKGSLPGDLKVKSYNASLLAMADYSEKQKAVSKITKAKLVVFITSKPVKLLGDPSIDNTLTIESGDQSEIDKIIAAIK